MSFETPILFLVFNRPETTKIVFEKIRSIKPRNLFIAADGPRDGNHNDSVNTKAVKKLCANIDWNCNLRTLYREENLGCKNAVSSAIHWFFEIVEYGIILEDDTIPSDSFFYYCEYLLQKYIDDSSVGHIGGFSLLAETKISDYYFSRLVPIWGWATWSRAWKHYDIEMSSFNSNDSSLYDGFGRHSRNVKRVFEKHLTDKVDTWDTQWAYTCVKNKFRTIVPFKSMIQNIGFSSDATHTKTKNSLIEAIQAHEFTLPLRDPPQNLADNCQYYDEKYLDLLYGSSGSKIFKLKNLVKKIFQLP